MAELRLFGATVALMEAEAEVIAAIAERIKESEERSKVGCKVGRKSRRKSHTQLVLTMSHDLSKCICFTTASAASSLLRKKTAPVDQETHDIPSAIEAKHPRQMLAQQRARTLFFRTHAQAHTQAALQTGMATSCADSAPLHHPLSCSLSTSTPPPLPPPKKKTSKNKKHKSKKKHTIGPAPPFDIQSARTHRYHHLYQQHTQFTHLNQGPAWISDRMLGLYGLRPFLPALSQMLMVRDKVRLSWCPLEWSSF